VVGVPAPFNLINMNHSYSAAPTTRGARLDTPRAFLIACLVVPLCFGLYSVLLGVDTNWDMLNYHVYNPFAWLHDKLLVDVAPAGMQTYFNPLLDVPFYWASTHLPARLVAFAYGWLHGLSFVLLAAIGRCALPGLRDGDRLRIPLLLALAGCLTGNFLSCLGNSMGDDTTALFVLAGLLVLLANWSTLAGGTARAVAVTAAAGALVGMSAGLKLTNAVYAVAMCAALLVYPGRALVRLRVSVLFGIGVLVGFAVTGGYWIAHMWTLFGNPLYPQFGSLFPNPHTLPNAVVDTRWRPVDLWETVVWPFIMAWHPKRVSETQVRQIIWPIVYVLLLLWAATGGARLLARRQGASVDARARFVVVFVAIGFVVWMKLFSIYRYIVPIELLAPFVVWVACHALLPRARARRAAGWLLAVATAVVLAGGAPTWGHAGWEEPVYHADLPTIERPQDTTVVISAVQGHAWGWVATQASPAVKFIQVGSGFPGTEAFRLHLRDAARMRGGPIYAIVDAETNWRSESVGRANRVVERLGLNRTAERCAMLARFVTRLRLHASVAPSRQPERQCELDLRADDVRDIAGENRANLKLAAQSLAGVGLALDAASCSVRAARVGDSALPYQWCRLSPLGD
jgi:hypothetical protein